jgi:hypothetical protein
MDVRFTSTKASCALFIRPKTFWANSSPADTPFSIGVFNIGLGLESDGDECVRNSAPNRTPIKPNNY